MLTRVEEQTKIIGLGLNIKGCFNIQFAIQGDDLYVLEVNPRSSRTVPFVAKSSDYHSQRLRQTSRLEYLYQNKQFQNEHLDRSRVKAPVFPFIKLRGLDPAPGPEMKSTGEVYGL